MAENVYTVDLQLLSDNLNFAAKEESCQENAWQREASGGRDRPARAGGCPSRAHGRLRGAHIPQHQALF